MILVFKIVVFLSWHCFSTRDLKLPIVRTVSTTVARLKYRLVPRELIENE